MEELLKTSMLPWISKHIFLAIYPRRLRWISHKIVPSSLVCRFQNPATYDDDLDGSYFRRKPTSFLSSNDAKRYTWMAPEEDPRPVHNGGPYVVGGSYPPKSSFLSQSSEQITG